LEVRKIETIEKGEEEAVGNKVRVKVVKNKVAPPFRKVELEIMFGKGISWAGSLIDAAVKYGVVDKKGAWYTWGEEKVGQGRDNAKLYMEQNPEAAASIEKRVRELIFSAQHPEPKQAESKSDTTKSADAPAKPVAAKGIDKVAEVPTAAKGPGRPPKQASLSKPTPGADKSAVPAEDEGLF
jgi:recombination protein RecA